MGVEDQIESDRKGEEEHAEEDGKVKEVRGAGPDGAREKADASIELEQLQELEGADEDEPPQHVSEQFIPIGHVLELDVTPPFGLVKPVDQVVGHEEAIEEYHAGRHGESDDGAFTEVPKALWGGQKERQHVTMAHTPLIETTAQLPEAVGS